MDARTVRTCEAIKDALAALLREKSLEDVSVSDLARAANISRSTLYCHYPNVSAVYDQLVQDFLNSVSPIEAQLKCSACNESHHDRPSYCEAVRSTEKYRGVVRQQQYIPTMMRAYEASGDNSNALAPYLSLGLRKREAQDLLCFQMVGCHMVATMTDDQAQWESRKKLLDTFIAGGMRAVRSAGMP